MVYLKMSTYVDSNGLFQVNYFVSKATLLLLYQHSIRFYPGSHKS